MSPAGKPSRERRENAGFTLLELLVVLLLLGLLSVAAPPLFSRSLEAMRMRSAIRDLASDLRGLRGAALAGHRETRLDFDLPRKSYTLTTDPTQRLLPTDTQLIVTTTVSNGTPLSNVVASIRFFPDGTSTGARIDLSEGPRHYAVRLDWLTSRVTIDE